jgi:hypothetical protein
MKQFTSNIRSDKDKGEAQIKGLPERSNELIIAALVKKRKANLLRLRESHEANMFWLNSSIETKIDISKQAMKAKQRTLMYFTLTMSMYSSCILNSTSILPTVKSFLQLFEEWEYHFSGSAMQSMKYVLAKNSPCIYPRSSPLAIKNSIGIDVLSPSLYKFDNSIVYEHLNITHVPFDLDHMEVFIGLCDALISLYDKFLSDECYT